MRDKMRFSVCLMSMAALLACGSGGGVTPEVSDTTRSPKPAMSTGKAYVIWYRVPGGYESAWIQETVGDAYDVLATRPEIVIGDGHALWAMRPSDADAPPCESDAPKTVARGVVFVPLGPGKESDPQRSRPRSDARASEWHHTVTPGGSFHERMILRRTGSAFECGAFDKGVDSAMMASVSASRDGEGSTHVSPIYTSQFLTARFQRDEGLSKQMTDPFCRERLGDELHVELIGIEKRGEQIVVLRRMSARDDYTLPTCGVAREDALELTAFTHAEDIRPAVRRALRERAADGPIGISPIFYRPGLQDAELQTTRAYFTASSAATPWPAPAPRDAIGDLLTQGALELERLRPATALAIYDRLLATSPEVARAWVGRARAKLLAGDLVGARADLRTALGLDSRPAFASDVHLVLASVAERAHQPALARTYYREAHRLNPTFNLESEIAALPEVELTFDRHADGRLRDHFSVIGMPAVSDDGSLIVTVDEENGLSVRIYRASDGKVVFTQTLFTPDEEAREGNARLDERVAAVAKKLDEHQWTSLLPLATDDTSATYRDSVLRLESTRRSEVYESTLRLDRTSGACIHKAILSKAWADFARDVLMIEFRFLDDDACPAPAAVTKLWRIPTPKHHAGWRVVQQPVLTLPDVADLCLGRTRLEQLLAPIGVIDYLSRTDYSERGGGGHRTVLVTGANAKARARSAFARGLIREDFCSECDVDEDTKSTCSPKPFDEVPEDTLSTCDQRGYGHGSGLICFVRRDTKSPWYVALIGEAEQGNEAQDAALSSALTAFHALLKPQPSTEPATADMLGGPEATCPGTSIGLEDHADNHLRSAMRARSPFDGRYRILLAIESDPAHVEARLAYARMLMKDGDHREAYHQLLMVRALAPKPAVLNRTKADRAFAAIAGEPLFRSIVEPASGLVPCLPPEDWSR